MRWGGERILSEKNKAGRARTSPEAEADSERWTGPGAETPKKKVLGAVCPESVPMMLALACGGMQDQRLAQRHLLSQQAQAPAKARGQSPWGDTLNLQYKQIKQPSEEDWKSVTQPQTQAPAPSPEGVKCLNSQPLLEYLRHASRIATRAIARLLGARLELSSWSH